MNDTYDDNLGDERSTGLRNRRMVVAGILFVVLNGLFLPFLIRLLRLAAGDDLYSHLPLIPLVSVYLVYIARRDISREWRSSWVLAGFWALLGGLALVGYVKIRGSADSLPANDLLFWPMASLVCLIYAVVAGCFGRQQMRAIWMELLFLFFFIPMPTPIVHASSVFLQYASADAVEVLLKLTGTTFYRSDQVFQMPGLSVEVALECSGIRSTLVLVVTGLLAGHLFLDRPWKKIVLMLLVVPLGILRNGFRIVTISLLTIHVNKEVINSPIHSRGGPFFFAVSLVVLFVLVFALRAIGRKRGRDLAE